MRTISGGFVKLWNEKQQCMPKENVQGKVTCNMEAFSECNHPFVVLPGPYPVVKFHHTHHIIGETLQCVLHR